MAKRIVFIVYKQIRARKKNKEKFIYKLTKRSIKWSSHMWSRGKGEEKFKGEEERERER